MKVHLKKLADQIIVITGASSGIGLTTARTAARGGAKVVLASRDESALREVVDGINQQGGRAIAVVADVGREADVEQVSQAAVSQFGGFDTWVNNAGISIYGRIEEVPVEDQRRLFETNYWGVVNGSRAAIRILKQRGGALVNVGSTLSDRAIPLQGPYCASKHAVKGFTDALRMELEEAAAPVSVTLIKPGAIDTPYPHHARNFLSSEPNNPPPVYAPEVVADAILYAAQHPIRDLFAGAGGKFISAGGQYAPRLMDKVMEKTMFRQQESGKPGRTRDDDSLYAPRRNGRQSGGYEGHVMKSSLYTKASRNPLMTSAVVVGAGLAIAALWGGSNNRDD